MRYVYEAMDRVKQVIPKGSKKMWINTSLIVTFIDSQRNKQLGRPWHVVGQIFNLTHFYDDPKTEFAKEIKFGVLICLTRLIPNLDDQNQITSELLDYKKKVILDRISLFGQERPNHLVYFVYIHYIQVRNKHYIQIRNKHYIQIKSLVIL